MSILAERLLESKKIRPAQPDQKGYETNDGGLHIADIVDEQGNEPARLYLDQRLQQPFTVQEIHIFLMGIFYPNLDPQSYQVNMIQSPISQRPEVEVVFQSLPVILTQPAA